MKPELKIAGKEEAPAADPVEQAVDEVPAKSLEEVSNAIPTEEKFQRLFVPLFFIELERSNFMSMASDAARFTRKDDESVGKKMVDVLDHFDNAMSIYCTSSHISAHLSELEAEGQIKSVQDLIDQAEELEAIYNDANHLANTAVLGENAKTQAPTVPYADFVEKSVKFVIEKLLKPDAIPAELLTYKRSETKKAAGEYNSIYKEEARAVVPLLYRSIGALTKEDAEYHMAASFMRMPLIVQNFEVMRSLLDQALKEKIQWGPYMHFVSVFNAAMYAVTTMIPNVALKGDYVPGFLGTILSTMIGGMIQVFSLDAKGAAENLVITIVEESIKMLEEGIKNNADGANTIGRLVPEQWLLMTKCEAYKNLAIGALKMVQTSDMPG